MRTLATQVRLKRAIRLHTEIAARLAGEGPDLLLAAVASARLLDVLGGVRAAWTADLGQAGSPAEMAALRRHVGRALSALEAAAAGLERPGAELAALVTEFREAAVPLVFFLRGLEETGDESLLAFLAPRPLRRSA